MGTLECACNICANWQPPEHDDADTILGYCVFDEVEPVINGNHVYVCGSYQSKTDRAIEDAHDLSVIEKRKNETPNKGEKS